RQLLHHLGAPKQSLRTTLLDYRRHPEDHHARAGLAFALFELRGALAARDWAAKRLAEPALDDPRLVAHALEVEASALIALRDFAAARRTLDRWKEHACAPDDRM